MTLTNDSTRVIALTKVDEQDEVQKYKDQKGCVDSNGKTVPYKLDESEYETI